jgi:hypothetical protein
MRTVHRITSLFVLLVTLYLGVTGTLIQVIDLKTLLRHAPATDPDMMAIREDKDGPDGFEVLGTDDYTALALPASFDYQAALPRLTDAARAAVGNAPLDFAEIRMGATGPVGQVKSGKRLLRLDFTTGRSQTSEEMRHEHAPSLRNDIKHIHRMTTFGDWALWINPIVGIALGLFVITGVVMYWRLLSARKRIKRPQWFWKAGDWWRTLHRWSSIVASLFILVIALERHMACGRVAHLRLLHERASSGSGDALCPSIRSQSAAGRPVAWDALDHIVRLSILSGRSAIEGRAPSSVRRHAAGCHHCRGG